MPGATRTTLKMGRRTAIVNAKVNRVSRAAVDRDAQSVRAGPRTRPYLLQPTVREGRYGNGSANRPLSRRTRAERQGHFLRCIAAPTGRPHRPLRGWHAGGQPGQSRRPSGAGTASRTGRKKPLPPPGHRRKRFRQRMALRGRLTDTPRLRGGPPSANGPSPQPRASGAANGEGGALAAPPRQSAGDEEDSG